MAGGEQVRYVYRSGGVTPLGLVGAGLAAFSSYSLGNGIGWIGIHALCGWLYLLYLCAGCGGGLPNGVFGVIL